MLKAIIFDFGQTLVDSAAGFRTAEKDAQHKIFRDIGAASWPDFLRCYRRLRKTSHDESDFSRKNIWQRVYQKYNKDPDKTLLENWEHAYWQKVESQTKLFPETEQVLNKLILNYQLALITNTQCRKDSSKHRTAQFPKLEGYFKEIIIAGESGIPPKPDPRPFKLCLEKLGITGSEAIYVGDDWYIDICGAQTAGIKPVWLRHYSVERNWPLVKTEVSVIRSLDQLLDMGNIIQ